MNGTDDLRGQVLRVIAIEEPPYMVFANLSVEAEEAMGTSPGVIIEILREMRDKLDIQ